jgi:hypothetical protein
MSFWGMALVNGLPDGLQWGVGGSVGGQEYRGASALGLKGGGQAGRLECMGLHGVHWVMLLWGAACRVFGLRFPGMGRLLGLRVWWEVPHP